MKYTPLKNDELELDFEGINTNTIFLQSAQINRAAQIATQVTNESQQWQTYLNALALFVFEEWLEERAPELQLDPGECSILQPNLLNSIAAVCNLKIGNFKVCLLATGVPIEATINCPRVVLELPEFAAHFYVAIEIQEEYDRASVQGFLSYSQIEQFLLQVELEREDLWNYRLPLNCFDPDRDRLLLYLRCLEPAAITLPEITQPSFANLADMQAEIRSILANFQASDRPWWEMLTWEQTTTLLLGQIYLQSERSPELFDLQNLLQIVTRSALNVSFWLEDKIDELAEGLSWVLLPVLTPAGAGLRAATEELENIITDLGSAGIEIPLQARGAYREIKLGEYNLRLYAVIWSFLSAENLQEWTLMLVLGCTSDIILPPNLKLRVSDSTGILVQRMTNQNNRDAYLYAQIAGSWDEKFLVSIALKDRHNNEVISVTLPPFTFRSQEL